MPSSVRRPFIEHRWCAGTTAKSFALITSSPSCEICIFSSVQIKKCMLREKEICLRSCSRWVRTVIFFFFNPNWPGSRAPALELIDKKTYCLTQIWEKIEWGRQLHPTPVLLPYFTFTFHFHALEKEMAAHSSILAWRIPGTEEPSGLPSMGLYRVEHNWGDLAAAAAAEWGKDSQEEVQAVIWVLGQAPVHWLRQF